MREWVNNNPTACMIISISLAVLTCIPMYIFLLKPIGVFHNDLKEALKIGKGIEGRTVIVQGCHYIVWHQRKYENLPYEERVSHDAACPNH